LPWRSSNGTAIRLVMPTYKNVVRMVPTVRCPSGLLAHRVTSHPAVTVNGTKKKSSARTAPPSQSGNRTNPCRSTVVANFQTPQRPVSTPTPANPIRIFMR
jgi:hypothetical protein